MTEKNLALMEKSAKFFRLSLIRSLLPESRTADCLRIIARGKNAVDLMHNADRGSARFANLCACGSGWICPVCAARISEKKARMLADGLARSQVSPLLITFTMEHHAGMRLKDMIRQLCDAYRSLQQARDVRAIKDRVGFLSAITALEMTHGENGFHPHFHALALCDRSLSEGELGLFDAEISRAWQAHLRRLGADCDIEIGTDVKQARLSVAAYVAKFGKEPADVKERNWGIEREITKGVSKASMARGGRSMQRVLLDSAGDANSPDGRLFREYYDATFGVKQVTVSRRAKELLGLDKAVDDDAALAASTDANEALLASLTREQWGRAIRPVDYRQEIIAIASTGDVGELARFLTGVGVL